MLRKFISKNIKLRDFSDGKLMIRKLLIFKSDNKFDYFYSFKLIYFLIDAILIMIIQGEK